jgi:hypothetical protein
MTKGVINYKNGKIYKIEPICEHDEGEIYIGSTTKQYLSQRMTAHRKGYKSFKDGKGSKVMAFDLFDKYGIENCDIILLQLVEANSRDELHTREAHYIKTTKCVNKYIPNRTLKEYYVDNKEKHSEQMKQYYKDHKDTIKELDHQRYERVKESLLQKRKEKYICLCGSELRISDKSTHEKSKKHQNYCLTI